MTVRRRLSLAASIAVAVAIALAALGAYFAVQARLRDELDASLRQRASEVQALDPFGSPPLPKLPRSIRPPEAKFGGAAGLVQFVGKSGRVVRPPGGGAALPVDQAAREAASGKGAIVLSDETVRGHHLRVLTAPLRGGGAVQIARPLNEVDSVLHDLVLILAAITVGGIGLAAILGGAVSRTSLRPIRRFTDQTEALAGGHELSRRLQVESEDEIGRLASSYNRLLDALERSADAQRQLVSDASHELRTPLTTIKTNLETMLRQNGGLGPADRAELERHLVEQVDELTMLVEDVVELARRGEPEAHLEEVRLDQIVEACCSRIARHSPSLHLDLDLEPSSVEGVPERLGRAVYNLLDNAVKWSSAEGSVDVRLARGVLSIRDHGPGIKPEDLPFVFDRFYRAREARGRPGSGLGLAIVRQIAEAHGAELEAANAPDGGAVTTLRFPAKV